MKTNPCVFLKKNNQNVGDCSPYQHDFYGSKQNSMWRLSMDNKLPI